MGENFREMVKVEHFADCRLPGIMGWAKLKFCNKTFAEVGNTAKFAKVSGCTVLCTYTCISACFCRSSVGRQRAGTGCGRWQFWVHVGEGDEV